MCNDLLPLALTFLSRVVILTASKFIGDPTVVPHVHILHPITAIFLVAALTFAGQKPRYSQLRFDHISTSQGLSQDIVKAIIQDRQGFMWFGTEDGLNRYDGYSIKVYKHNSRDTTSLSDNDVHALYEDRQHRLWIGTGGGLDLYNREKDSFLYFKHDSTNPRSMGPGGVMCLQEDASGRLWIGTSAGLNRYDEQHRTFAHYLHNRIDTSSINSNFINSILLDRSGMLWIGTSNGFCSFDEPTGRVGRYLYSGGSGGEANVVWLQEDRSRTIWAAQTEHGVWWLDAARRELRPVPLSSYPGLSFSQSVMGDAVVSSMAEDSKGSVWIGHFRGLDIYNPLSKKFTHYFIDPDDPAALGGRVGVVYRDKVGMMWLGTFQGGVYRYDPNRQKFQLYRNNPNSSNVFGSNYTLSVFEDTTGALWIGHNRGLDRRDANSNRVFHYRHDALNSSSIGSEQVNAILRDKEGNLWIGGTGGTNANLDQFDETGNRFIHFPVTSVRTIYEDREGELWLGLLDEQNTGVNLVRMDRRRRIVARLSAPGNGVWCIFEDRDGYLWLGGQYNYLNRFNKKTGRFINFRAKADDSTALGSNAVRAIFQDDSSTMWFGTWGSGLYSYDEQTNRFSPFLEQDGLANNYVKSILPDDHGNLWVATEKGLSRFDPRTRRFKNFTAEDGLQGDRFLSGSCFKTKDGRMYFGGTQGLNVFHPDSIRDNPNIPPVVITAFKVFDKQMPLPQSAEAANVVELTYNQDFFSFEFVALDYTAPHKNQYAYMLEGFDKNWVTAGTRRYAAYTGVAPGKYVFRVRGSNSDGIWNTEGVALRIVIAPPFWGTWWFIILALLSALVMLYLAYRYRVNQLLAIERLRARIAGDLHDDVGTDLSSIVLATQSIERRLPSTSNQRDEVRQIGSIALRTQEMMRDIVWVLSSRNDTINDLILKMREATKRILGTTTVTFKAPDIPLPEKMALDFKRTIFLFYKECLNNIVKHASASGVEIEVRSVGRGFVLTIADNGKGYNPNSHSSGLGLKSLRARAEQINGELYIWSEPGKGTKITLTVKTT